MKELSKKIAQHMTELTSYVLRATSAGHIGKGISAGHGTIEGAGAEGQQQHPYPLQQPGDSPSKLGILPTTPARMPHGGFDSTTVEPSGNLPENLPPPPDGGSGAASSTDIFHPSCTTTTKASTAVEDEFTRKLRARLSRVEVDLIHSLKQKLDAQYEALEKHVSSLQRPP